MENINCDDCINCVNCKYYYNSEGCEYCYKGKFCIYSAFNKYCDYCDRTNFSNICEGCYNCAYCYNCYNCLDLNFSECNYFCFGLDEEEEDKNKNFYRYRIFNKQVSKEKYDYIKIINMKLQFDINESCYTRYKTAFKNAWNKLSEEDKQSIITLPGFNKEDFLKYYGVEIKGKEEEIITIGGNKYFKRDVEESLKNIKIV